ncbi:MAG: phytoene/squalene synthase family protein [Bacteroidia bacterium]|nr:phytoene/squalene synthase family protein [Bacteroidia bacterium]
MIATKTGFWKYHDLSIEISRQVTRSYSTSFYSATQLFSPSVREAIYGIYGFVRLADEIVDSFHGHDQRAMLDRFEADYDFAREQGVSSNPVIHSFLIAVKRYGIEDAYIRAFLSSMRADLDKKVYATRVETDQYIYGSADVVGLMCLCVFCENNKTLFEELRLPAMRLGSAFQKVNFLRDLRQDVVELGRLYFPGFSMEQFNEQSKQELVRDIQADFTEALEGIRRLPDSSRLAVHTAYRYYSRLLDKIRDTPAQKLVSRRIRVPNAEKFRLLLGAIIKHKFHFEFA